MADDLMKYRPKPEDSKWKINSREIIHENSWYRYIHDRGKLPNGKDFDYYYVQVEFSMGVLPVIDGQLLLVRQYRYLTGRLSLEVPGGGGKFGESPKSIAKRELLEETGYQAGQLLDIGNMDVANGYSSDVAHVFIATKCKKASKQNLDATEVGMKVELHPIEKVYEMVQEGKITDSFTLAALMMARPHLL